MLDKTFFDDIQALPTDKIYAKFHEIQWANVYPQWVNHLRSAGVDSESILTVAFPKAITGPDENYVKECVNKIQNSSDEVLLLPLCLDIEMARMPILNSIAEMAPKFVAIYYSAPTQTYYETKPLIPYIDRTNSGKNFAATDVDPKTLELIETWAASSGFSKIHEGPGDMRYDTEDDKKRMMQTEILFGRILKEFEKIPVDLEIQMDQLLEWFHTPDSFFAVTKRQQLVIYENK